ncbi:hypothetical protein [Micromonospora echinofusca]|uniref:YbaB/EbfC DNA-binding family protein n=1 Tax=Micromonospora echinofusca TaxID=47858 RepID=A0ABS3VPW4_MICEH|nr:hypothetical protein [Micromonospora echinofusca]MBO4206550.1 hypothetical protein [Micromonospora echinofusca]
MRGELDEALARMARREELLRRRSAPVEGRSTAPPGGEPLAEVTEAVRRVVAAHPGLSVDLEVDHDGTARQLRIAWSGETVTVTSSGAEATGTVPDSPPPAWPLPVTPVPVWSVETDGLSDDPDARLAELLRRNPTLLENLRRSGDPS